MRDIKFRAWDKENNIWRDTDLFIICPDNGVVIEIDYVDGRVVLDEVNHEVILEQYTGLKDFNDVEICEGDIVKTIKEDVDFEDEVYQIVYNETGDYPAFDLKGWRGEINGISELSANYGIEVIGNIHEQPELLEDK